MSKLREEKEIIIMNQLKMTFGVEQLNQLGDFLKPKRRRKRVVPCDAKVMDEFLNPEKIETFLNHQLEVKESLEVGNYRCDWMSFPTHHEVVLVKASTNEILQYEWLDTEEAAKSYFERTKKMVHIFNKFKK